MQNLALDDRVCQKCHRSPKLMTEIDNIKSRILHAIFASLLKVNKQGHVYLNSS
jgi:hypothetical protein